MLAHGEPVVQPQVMVERQLPEQVPAEQDLAARDERIRELTLSLSQKEEELVRLKKENEALRMAATQVLAHLEQGAGIIRAMSQPIH